MTQKFSLFLPHRLFLWKGFPNASSWSPNGLRSKSYSKLKPNSTQHLRYFSNSLKNETTPNAVNKKMSSSADSSVICAGCGSHLQTRNKAAAGYILTEKKSEALRRLSEQALERAQYSEEQSTIVTLRDHGMVCQRCYDAKHFGKLVPLAVPESVYKEYLQTLSRMGQSSISSTEATPSNLILLVLDIWDFHSKSLNITLRTLFEPSIRRATLDTINGKPIDKLRKPRLIVVVNKIDLLPLDVNLDRISRWAAQEIRQTLLDIVSEVSRDELRNLSSHYQNLDERTRVRIDGFNGKMLFNRMHLVLVDTTDVSGSAGSASTRRNGQKKSDTAATSKSHSDQDEKDMRPLQRRTALGGVVDISCVSANSGAGMTSLLEKVRVQHRGVDVYIVGAPNVGKSSVINALLARKWSLSWLSSVNDEEVRGGSRSRPFPSSEGATRRFKLKELDQESQFRKLAASLLGDSDNASKQQQPLILDSAASLAPLGLTVGAEISSEELESVPAKAEAERLSRAQKLLEVPPGAPLTRRGEGILFGEASPLDMDPLALEKRVEGLLGSYAARIQRRSRSTRKHTHRLKNEANSLPASILNSNENPLDDPLFETTGEILEVGAERVLELRSRLFPLYRQRHPDLFVSTENSEEPPMPRAQSSSGPLSQSQEASFSPSKLKKLKYKAAPLPFSTSPLPGTTLGVLGAPLDPHGHVMVFDTPGIVESPLKQRLFEGVTFEVTTAAGEAWEGLYRGSTQAINDSKWTARLPPLLRAVITPPAPIGTQSQSESKALRLLVPQRKKRTPLTFLLRPGRSLLFGGLGRLDYRSPSSSTTQNMDSAPLQSKEGHNLLVTVFFAGDLRVHCTSIEKANALGERALAVDVMRNLINLKDGQWWDFLPSPISEDLLDDSLKKVSIEVDNTLDVAAKVVADSAPLGQTWKNHNYSISEHLAPAEPSNLLLGTEVDFEEARSILKQHFFNPLSFSPGTEVPTDGPNEISDNVVDSSGSSLENNQSIQQKEYRKFVAASNIVWPRWGPLVRVGMVALRDHLTDSQLEALEMTKRLDTAADYWRDHSASSGHSDNKLTKFSGSNDLIGANEGPSNAVIDLKLEEVAYFSEFQENSNLDLRNTLNGCTDEAVSHERVEPSRRQHNDRNTKNRGVSAQKKGKKVMEPHPGSSFTTEQLREIQPGQEAYYLQDGVAHPLASLSKLLEKKKLRQRRAIVDIVYNGLGWISITPVEIEGQMGYYRSVSAAKLDVYAAKGVHSHVRKPLLPFEASGLKSGEWTDTI